MLSVTVVHSILARTGPLYLDPGSGSMLLQAVLGAILAVGIGVRVFWSKIKSLFARKDPRATGDGNEERGV